jgi:nitroimidazol reductase NimA-like FMN-containing flavoprotein (pyridoxamine 5'-phosphate oxidase superfamily)
MANTFRGLLTQLLQGTDSKKIKWGETADSLSFRIGLGGGMVRITADQGSDEYRAYLIDSNGRIVEVEDDSGTSTLLGRLFSAARASALDVDGLLEGMMADLQRGKVVTPPPDDEKPPPGGGGEDIPF